MTCPIGTASSVSTRAQDLALQLDALEHAGCQRVYRDVGSGSIRARPQLDACLEHLLPGDTLVVWRWTASAASLRHLIDVIAGLQQREIAFRSLRERIDTTTANAARASNRHQWMIVGRFDVVTQTTERAAILPGRSGAADR